MSAAKPDRPPLKPLRVRRATAATAAADRLEQLQAEHRERGVEIDKSTAVTRWAGERMDYSTAIEWLLNRDGIDA